MIRRDWRTMAVRVAFWAVAIEATQLIGCGCGSVQERPGATTGLEPSGAVASVSPASSAPQATAAVVQEDPRKMTLVLQGPRLAAVRAALDAGDPARAAREMRVAIGQHQPQGVEKARWSLLLGRMLVDAKDPAGAATELDQAASEPTWVLRDLARVEAAEAYVAAGKHAEARVRAEAVSRDASVADRALLVRADALDGLGDKEQALRIWKERLAADPGGARWEVGALRLARALLEQPTEEARVVDALQWLRRVMSEAPSTSHEREARGLEEDALGKLAPAQRARLSDWPVETRLRRAQVLADRGRRADALDELEALLEDLSGPQREGSVGCAATALKGKLQSQVKKTRQASADTYVEAVRRCERHKGELAGVLYAGAKVLAQVGRLGPAAAMFARIEKEFGGNRLADDARLRGARVALLMRNEAKFETMLSAMGSDYPEGDMVEDGLFELALHHIDKGAWDKAIVPLERSVQERPREKQHWVSGRARYFLGRAYEATGRSEQGHDAYRQVILEHPLSYYMILAHGRLRARAPELAAETLRKAETAVEPEQTPGELPAKLKGPAFERAVELLRLGDVAGGRAEVKSLGLGEGDGEALWVVARVYERAGDARLAHQVARMRTDEWSRSYPRGRWRDAWELAYPQVYLDLVRRETDASGIPMSLAYGIMREESAFDAAVVSWADAYGLMQLIMPTATSVARSLQMKVDETSLKRPEVNIRLGCKLLGSLRGKFPSAPVMAIPSYNAGAGATERWLRERSADDFDLWVERITYEETRGYTKRVLSSVAVYAYLYEPNDLVSALQLPDQLDL